MRIRYRLLAAQQLEELVDYYDSLGPAVRRKFQRSVKEALKSMAQSPLSCLRVTERTLVFILRPFKIGIFFEVTGKIIQITRIVDLRSDWQSGSENWN